MKLLKQIESKRDRSKEDEAKVWIETISGCKFDPDLSFEQNLRNGIILCKYVKD